MFSFTIAHLLGGLILLKTYHTLERTDIYFQYDRPLCNFNEAAPAARFTDMFENQ